MRIVVRSCRARGTLCALKDLPLREFPEQVARILRIASMAHLHQQARSRGVVDWNRGVNQK